MSKEITTLKLKLLKAGSSDSSDKNVEELEKKINELKNKNELLLKQILDIKKDKITETNKLNIEMTKLKVEISTLKKQLDENKKEQNIDTKSQITTGGDIDDIRKKNKELEEENILLKTELEDEKNKSTTNT